MNMLTFMKEDNYIRLSSIYFCKIIVLLELGETEKAKMTLINAKKHQDIVMGDEKSDEETRNDVNLNLYQAYYHYYKSPLIDNVKKAIINGIGHLKISLKTASVQGFMDSALEFSDYCIAYSAFRQSEYIIRVIEHILTKERKKIENIESQEIFLTVQQARHVLGMLLYIVKYQKIHYHFKSLDIPEVSDTSDSLLDGSVRDEAKLLDLYVKGRALVSKTDTMLKKHQDSSNIGKKCENKIEFNIKILNHLERVFGF